MSVNHRPGLGFLVPIAALAGGIGIWWLFVAVTSIPPYLLPSPVVVGERLMESPRFYLRNAWFTFEKIAYGGAIGITGGFALAVAITYLPWVRRAVQPYVVTIRVLPKIAVAPVLLIYMGVGFSTAVVFVALISFFPMVISASTGLDNVPDRSLDLLRSVDASELRTFFAVRLPYGLPDLFAGLKQSITLAVIGAVVAEWIVADDGLGYLILFASEGVQTDLMVAAVVVLFVEGLALYGAVLLVQRFVLWTNDS